MGKVSFCKVGQMSLILKGWHFHADEHHQFGQLHSYNAVSPKRLAQVATWLPCSTAWAALPRGFVAPTSCSSGMYPCSSPRQPHAGNVMSCKQPTQLRYTVTQAASRPSCDFSRPHTRPFLEMCKSRFGNKAGYVCFRLLWYDGT